MNKKEPQITETENNKFHKEFTRFVLEEDHPCVMAQSIFELGHVDFHVYDNFPSAETGREILKDIETYLSNYDFESNDFRTFMAVFKDEKLYSEKEFEQKLWEQLQLLHDLDNKNWDHRVSSDPENDNFSFSLGGRAFYMVGMHPNSSRLARKSPYPAIAFNLHWQFEKLREMNVYQNVRDKIRERDKERQGNINPMLEDFGERSEARQYSGRQVKEDWKCPFHQSGK